MQLFTAMDHGARQKIIRLIHGEGEMSRVEILSKMELETTIVSHHLAVLMDQQVLFAERRGRLIYYSVNYKKVREAHRIGAMLYN